MQLLKQPMAEYLAYRLGPNAVLEREERFGRGCSRVTWFVDFRASPSSPDQQLIFRGDRPGGSTTPTSLEQEYFMNERPGRSAVLVARLHGLLNDAASYLNGTGHAARATAIRVSLSPRRNPDVYLGVNLLAEDVAALRQHGTDVLRGPRASDKTERAPALQAALQAYISWQLAAEAQIIEKSFRRHGIRR